MKVLVVCQYYYPENFQVTPICEQMVQDGYEVTVLTGLPNYPLGKIPSEYKKRDKWDEYINGVHVIRCLEFERKTGAIWLAVNYVSFYVSAMRKVRMLKKDFDCVFVYQLSPILMGLPGKYYSQKHQVPLYLYCCDLWPESIKMYLKNDNNILFKFVKGISKKVYEACDVISVQSKTFIDYFASVHQISKEKLVYIPAFSDDKYLARTFYRENGVTDFVFLGNIGIAQNVELIIEAADKIRDCNFKLHIVGDGSCLEKIRNLVTEKQLGDRVVFYGRRPVEEMEQFYELADVCLVTLNAENVTGLTLPAKVQGYMAAGKPIIGMIDGAARDVINDSKCGICVSAGDVDGLAEAMKDFIEKPEKYISCGENGRRYFMENFKCSKIICQIEEVINSLVTEKQRLF